MPTASILEHFSAIEDPRVDRQNKHQLQDIFFITLCAVISGANNWVVVEQFGQSIQESSDSQGKCLGTAKSLGIGARESRG